jgi:hypothetical protein
MDEGKRPILQRAGATLQLLHLSHPAIGLLPELHDAESSNISIN